MVVAIRTGLRVGEMVALHWTDVDLDRGRLHVQRSYSRETGEFTSTKNDKHRELPLAWGAIEALRVQRGRVDGELVFARGGRPPRRPCGRAGTLLTSARRRAE